MCTEWHYFKRCPVCALIVKWTGTAIEPCDAAKERDSLCATVVMDSKEVGTLKCRLCAMSGESKLPSATQSTPLRRSARLLKAPQYHGADMY